MIAKIKSRVDFSCIVNYANNVKEKSARIIGNNGGLLIDNSTIADSFQAQLRIPDANGKLHHLSKPVKHVSIAFSPEDAHRFPDNEEGDRFMAQLAEEWMQEMGIDPYNTQYVIARHFDKQHPHCHLVFNHIANNGSVISDSNERRRNEAACRRIKQRHGLTFGNRQSQRINPDRLTQYGKYLRMEVDVSVAGYAELQFSPLSVGGPQDGSRFSYFPDFPIKTRRVPRPSYSRA